MLGLGSINRIAWSLRKALLPTKPSDLVLDVGSGDNPHPAADVLLERYLEPKHRWSRMVVDRPTVLANACKMPFRDKTFDYVIAFHVLEHVDDPAAFLLELQRVSKAGYIETPNALFERLIPYDIHLLEVMNIDETLVIHKKESARPDPFLNELEITKHSPTWNQFFYGNPNLFHVRYFWTGNIRFKVINPDTSLNWFVDQPVETSGQPATDEKPGSRGARGLGLSLLRKYYRLRKRNEVNLDELLCCPECHGSLEAEGDNFICGDCQVVYPRLPTPDFNNGLARPRKMAVSSC